MARGKILKRTHERERYHEFYMLFTTSPVFHFGQESIERTANMWRDRLRAIWSLRAMWSDTTAMDNLRADHGSTVTTTIVSNTADTNKIVCHTSHDISPEQHSRHAVYKVVATGPEMDICCNGEFLLAGRENLDRPTSAASSPATSIPESVDPQGKGDSPVIVSRASRSDATSARRSSCPIIRSPIVAHSELNYPDKAFARRSSCPIVDTGSLQADAARLHRHVQVRAPVAEDVLVEFFGIQPSCPSAASAIPVNAQSAAVPGVPQTAHTFLCQDNQCLPTILARRLGRTFDDTDVDGFQIHLDSLLDSANANQRLSDVLQRLSPDSNSLIRDSRSSTSEF